MEKGDARSAERVYRDILRTEPDDPIIVYNLAKAFEEQGRLADAISHFERATQLKPDFPEAFYSLGTSLWQQGKLEAAKSSIRRSLDLRPQYAEAMIALGAVSKAQGDLEGAIRAFRQSLQIRFQFPEAHYSLGLALRQQGNYEESLEEIRTAESQRRDKANTEAATFATYTGIKMSEAGKFDAALQQFQLALQQAPSFAPAHYQMSLVLEKQARSEEAAKSRAQAQALDPGLRLCRSELGLRGWVQAKWGSLR